MSVTVVPATVEHLPWLRLLFTELVADGQAKHPLPYPIMDDAEYDAFTAIVYRHLTTNPRFGAWVAKVDDQIAGFLAGEMCDRAVGRPHEFAAPHYLFVRPAFRALGGKHGIARLLIEEAIAWARAQGATHIEVAALEGDTQWEERGFLPYLRKFYVPIDALRASAHVEQPEPKVPAPKVYKRRRKGRMNGHDITADA